MNNLPELSIFLLGPTQIMLDGRPLNFRTNKVQALLCFLVVEAAFQPGIAFRREALMELLWPDMPLKSAQDNLRQTLYQLRKLIPNTAAAENTDPQSFILSDRLTIEINPKSLYYLDVAEFQKLLNPEPDFDQLEQAARLYRGDFLADFYLTDSSEYEAWAAAKRLSLRTQALDALDTLTSTLSNKGEFNQAKTFARRQLEIDNLREQAHRQLMTILFEEGRRSEALQQYEKCQQLLLDELGVEPSPETSALYEQIRTGKKFKEQPKVTPVVVAPGLPKHNLPAQTTSFVGRQEELANVINLLSDPNCRLLTILGPGGIGKTRLSIQVASTLVHSQTENFPDGIFIVPLAAAPTMDYLVPAVAEAIGFSFSGSREPKNQLLVYLKNKKILLVLDNLEHLAGESALLSNFLTAVPGLTFLVTSRARLNLYEEWQFELKGLSVPAEQDATNLETYSAIQLFVQRARQAGLASLSNKELPVIVQICQLLAGMPLAIELAAGWVRTYTCIQIAAEIQRDLEFLSTTIHNVPERHRSLHVVFEHSWHLLSDETQKIFARLTVFREGFDQDAAKLVANASPINLARLVDNSMLHVTDGRFYMNELLRQYGAEKLKSDLYSDIYQDAHNRHASYYADFLQQREPFRWTAGEPAVLDEIAIELKNILTGWHWTIAVMNSSVPIDRMLAQIGRYTTMLAYFYEQRNRYHEGIQLFQEAASSIDNLLRNANNLAGNSLDLAKIQTAEASLRFHLSQFHEVEKLVSETLQTFQETESEMETAAAFVLLGMTKNRLGLYREANLYFEESLSIFEKLGARVASGEALNGLGIVAVSLEKFDQAGQHLQESLDIYTKTGYLRGVARAYSNQGTSFVRSGRYDQAMPLYKKALEAARKINDVMVIAAILSNLGSISRIMGNYDTSLGYYEQSLTMFRDMGERRWIAVDLNGMGETLLDMGRLDMAKSRLRQSLEISMTIQSVPDILDSLAALGQISAETGHHEQAIQVLTFVVEHPVTKPLARARCKRVLIALQEVVSSQVWKETVAAAQKETLEGLTSTY